MIALRMRGIIPETPSAATRHLRERRKAAVPAEGPRRGKGAPNTIISIFNWQEEFLFRIWVGSGGDIIF